MQNSIYQDTIVALSTPTGSGAIAVIRLTGEKAIDIVEPFFVSKVSLQDAEPRKAIFGEIKNDSGALVDEVLITKFVAPNSYTGEDMVEISCHGSSFIIQQLLDLSLDHGAKLAEPGEFTMRAFINGKMDLSQAEAVSDVITSENQTQHDIAMKQMRGGYSSNLAELRDQLIEFASLVELELDFSEEDVEFADRSQLTQLVQTLENNIEELISSFAYGNVIKDGVPVVIAGKPNAGKSSLLNALLNEYKAIVSDIAGTTRDSIEDTFLLNGVKYRITDTAGLRDTTDEIEAIGVQRSLDKIRDAKILIYLFDLSDTSAQEVIDAVNTFYRPDLGIILAQTHIDLYKHGEYEDAYNEIAESLSGKYRTQMGLALKGEAMKPTLELLKMSLSSYVEDMKPQGSIIVTNTRHVGALKQAQNALSDVKKGMENQVSSDFLAQDIRIALQHIGSITGQVDVDKDILGTIFGKFCVGK